MSYGRGCDEICNRDDMGWTVGLLHLVLKFFLILAIQLLQKSILIGLDLTFNSICFPELASLII